VKFLQKPLRQPYPYKKIENETKPVDIFSLTNKKVIAKSYGVFRIKSPLKRFGHKTWIFCLKLKSEDKNILL